MSRKTKIGVAMSGGVDSSTAAMLLKNAGYEVTGYTMTLGIQPEQDNSAIESARLVAERLGIVHYKVELSQEFRERVIDYFVSEYMTGKTPNPCVVCNRDIKFGALLERAFTDGNELFSTGHYVKIENDALLGCKVLKRGADRDKDQSYFLFNIRREILSRLVFPLGDVTKKQVLELAAEEGLKAVERPESSDACFLGGGSYSDFLESLGIQDRPGEIRYMDGRVLGTHDGCHRFTIGQRKGLRIAFSQPLYVVEIDAGKNLIIAGTKEHLFKRSLLVKNVNLLYPLEEREIKCMVKIRYKHSGAPAIVDIPSLSEAKVTFDEPQMAATPGQAAVFYKDDILIGGGWIE